MGKFAKDQSGSFPITFYGVMFIVAVVSIGLVVARASSYSIKPVSQIRLHASAKPCTTKSLGSLFGKPNCRVLKRGVDGNSIVFLKAK